MCRCRHEKLLIYLCLVTGGFLYSESIFLVRLWKTFLYGNVEQAGFSRNPSGFVYLFCLFTLPTAGTGGAFIYTRQEDLSYQQSRISENKRQDCQ